MGAWGTGIYSNDTAADLRDTCKDIFAFYDVEDGNRRIFEIFAELIAQKQIDNDYASFWYALADWQWKHGMLTENIKEKAVTLLSDYAGIEEWEESGNKRDVAKRKRTLDLLRTQLQSPQPPMKKPKIHLCKPKHKTGDIIIFKATDYIDEWDSSWNNRFIRPPIIFRSAELSKSQYEDIDGYEAHGKYMAILCVGSEKELYSEYIPDLFDENSVYVWYNYLSAVCPSVEQLNTCGFLPMIVWKMKEFSNTVTESVSWVYRLTLTAESFKSDPYTVICSKLSHNENEVERFYRLLSQKPYSQDYYNEAAGTLTSVFDTAFEEASRAKVTGMKIDDLLDPDVKNPELLSPAELDEVCKKRFSEL